MLYRAIARGHILVAAAWLLIVALSLPYALQLDDVTRAETEALLPEDAESRLAALKLEKLLDDAAGEDPALAVQGALATADAIILVTSLPEPLSYEFYQAASSWYPEFASAYNAFSWIDLVEAYGGDVRERAREAVLQAAQAYAAGEEAWRAYSEAYQQLEPLDTAVAELDDLVLQLDIGYSEIASSWDSLAAARAQIERFSEPVVAVCYPQPGIGLGPTFAETFLDVVRTEAILEFYTNAYTEGLDDVDLTVVELLTYVPQAGLESVDRGLAVYIYSVVTAAGGPQEFDNLMATQITYQILAGMGGWDERLLQAYAEAWGGAVSSLPDLKLSLVQDPEAGQASLAARVRALEPQVSSAVAQIVAGRIAEQLPDEAFRQAFTTYARLLIEGGCRPGDQQPLVQALSTLIALTSGGLDKADSEALAAAFVEGDREAFLDRVARTAVGLAYGRAPEGAQLPPPEVLVKVLREFDPEASGILAVSPEARREAVKAILVTAYQLPPDIAQLVVDGKIGEAARSMVISGFEAAGGPQAVEIARLVLEPEPAPTLQLALERVRGYVVATMAAQGLEEQVAEELAAAALRGYLEGDPEAAAALASETLARELVAEVLDAVRGVMVEEDLKGFIVFILKAESIGFVEDARARLEEGVKQAAGDSVEIYLAGDLVVEVKLQEAIVEDLRRSDLASGVLVVVILAVVLGTILGVALPFLGIGAGLALAMALVYLAASQDLFTVTSEARAIMFTTGLGLGIDYSAFVARKFRENLRGARGAWEAAGKAAAQSVRAILAGGLAAAIGFSTLTLALDFPFVQSIGYTAPIAILSVVLASLTLTPALLALLGWAGLLWFPTCPYKPYKPGSRAFRILATGVSRAAVAVLPLVLVLGLAGLYYTGFQFEGEFDTLLSIPQGSEVYQAFRLIYSDYSPQKLFPQFVVASSPEAAQRVAEKLRALECVDQAVASGSVVHVTLLDNPLETEAVRCVEKVRAEAKDVDEASLVGGVAAVNLDLQNLLYEAFYERVIPAAAVLIPLVILAFYKSIPAALVGLASIAFSAGWAIAIVDRAREALGIQPPWFLPIVTVAALLGVGMDYISFYVNAAKEKFEQGGNSNAYHLEASEVGTGLVVGLAAIMAGAYSGLLLSSVEALRVVGLTLALGVALAGVSASILIIPVFMALLGARFWWPGAGRKGGVGREKGVEGGQE